MSRIGKQPVVIPQGVQVTVSGSVVKIKGPLGTLEQDTFNHVKVNYESAENKIFVTRHSDEKQDRAYHGLYQRLLQNMVEGVTKGYKRDLEIVGVGYKAEIQGKTLVMNLGYSHQVKLTPPEGVKVEVPKPTVVSVSGISKQAVGHFAAVVRKSHPPEPYKGKGVRYLGEVIKKKVGKTGAK